MNTIIKPALVLSLVAFFSALVLSHIRGVTYPVILQQELEKQQKALNMVLPGYSTGKEQSIVFEDGSTFIYWAGEKTEEETVKKGYAFISVNYGYSGNIKAMVGVDDDNKILGISIIQQTETPGLGARVTEKVSNETIWGVVLGRGGDNEISEPWFQEQFRGLDLNRKIMILKKGIWTKEIKDELIRKNAVCAITGATITTKAITGGLREGLIKLKKVKHMLQRKEEGK